MASLLTRSRAVACVASEAVGVDAGTVLLACCTWRSIGCCWPVAAAPTRPPPLRRYPTGWRRRSIASRLATALPARARTGLRRDRLGGRRLARSSSSLSARCRAMAADGNTSRSGGGASRLAILLPQLAARMAAAGTARRRFRTRGRAGQARGTERVCLRSRTRNQQSVGQYLGPGANPAQRRIRSRAPAKVGCYQYAGLSRARNDC